MPEPRRDLHKDGSVKAVGQTEDGELTGYWEWFRKDGSKEPIPVEKAAGDALRTALFSAIADGQKTRDIGGELGTRAFTSVVRDRLSSSLGAG